MLAQIYREFLSETRSRLEELSSGPGAGTRPTLAHTIKGTAGMLGACALAGCAESLEGACDEEGARNVLAAMWAACAALDAALRERRILP